MSHAACCDTCSCKSVPYPVLDILSPGAGTHQRLTRKAQRHISEQLAEQLRVQLVEERKKIMEEITVHQMLGPSIVCSDGVIKELFEILKFLCSSQDVKVFGLRPELRDRFFNVVINTVVDAPPVKRWKK